MSELVEITLGGRRVPAYILTENAKTAHVELEDGRRTKIHKSKAKMARIRTVRRGPGRP